MDCMRDDTSADISRRHALRLGAAAIAVSAAGCIESLGSDEETPEYASSIIEGLDEFEDEDEDGLVFFYMETLEEESEEEADDREDGDDVEDPMLSAVGAPFGILFLGGFVLAPTGLDELIGGGFGFEDEEEDQPEFDTEIDEILMVDGALMMRGDIDTDEADDLLREESDAFFGFGSVVYEPDEEVGEYTLYKPELGGEFGDGSDDDAGDGEEMDDETVPVAVADDEILVGSRANIDMIRETRAGDRETLAEESEEFEWLVSNAGDGTWAFGAYGVEEEPTEDAGDTDEIDEAFLEAGLEPVGIVNSLSFDTEVEEPETFDAAFAASFEEEIGEDGEDVIEEYFGTEAEEIEFEFDGNRVFISGTYEELVD